MLEKINLAKIPLQLREVAQWVLWKLVHRGNDVTKIPFQLDGVTTASSTNDQTWASFDDMALAMFGALEPGFVFTAEDPFAGIDLDGCRNPETGVIADWAKKIIRAANSYAEVSPSRTGVKIFVQGTLPSNMKWNLDETPVSEKKPGIELYDHERYFAVTGWRLASVPETVNPAQPLLDLLVGSRPGKNPIKSYQPSEPTEQDVVERASKYVGRMPAAVSGQRGHDAAFKVACVLALGFGLCDADAMGLMMEYNQRCEPQWNERELRHKLDSAMQQNGDKNYLRHASRDDVYAVKVPAYVDPAKPKDNHSIKMPEPPKMTNLRDATGAYLKRMIEVGDKLVETGLPSDVDHAIGGGLEFGEEVIMAARPSHGKSANALQCIHYWTKVGYPSLFVSEEMSAYALGKRTVQYATAVHREHWATSMSTVEFECNAHFHGRAPCFIAENSRHVDTVAEIIGNAVKNEGVKCVVVDYAQLLNAEGRSRYEKITNVSVVLRQLCNEHQIIMLVLAQLSREIEKRDQFVPKMSDLKETGQLEQDADVILMNVWPWKINDKEDKSRYLFYVAKVRNREVNRGVVDCRFEPSRQMLLEAIAPLEKHVKDWT